MTLSSRRNARSGLIVTMTLFISACAATISSGSHFDETADITGYRTFAWISHAPFVRGEADSIVRVSALTQKKIETAIVAELEAKQYIFTEDTNQADFLVGYTVGSRQKLARTSYPNYFRGNWAWHVNGGRYYYGEYTREHSYTKGTLGVDIFDGLTGEPIWHGWAEKTITGRDREDPSEAIKGGARQLLAGFPQRSE